MLFIDMLSHYKRGPSLSIIRKGRNVTRIYSLGQAIGVDPTSNALTTTSIMASASGIALAMVA